MGYVASLLAAWRIGAQVSLLDHRLSRAEVDKALDRLAPQVVVEAADVTSQPMSGYATLTARAGAAGQAGSRRRRRTALIQLSSGSTGPSKVIARTSADLLAELDRYAKLDDYPGAGTQPSCCWPRSCTCSAWSAACCTACTPALSSSSPTGLPADGIAPRLLSPISRR